MNKELKENIMQGTLQAFNQKGLKFTMDDIAKILGISKKTIYQVFRDKEALFLETVDYLFDRIKDSEQKIVENQEMDTLQKIHTILGVMPECYQDVDFRQLYQLKEKYPEIYHQVEVRTREGEGAPPPFVGGRGGRGGPSGPDSDFKDDAGSIVRAVFSSAISCCRMKLLMRRHCRRLSGF